MARNDKQKLLTRRAVIFGGLQLAGMAALAGRLYYLQFVRSDEYRTLSENNRIKLQLLTPERGRILDRNGALFALNEKNYLLFLDATGRARAEVKELLGKVRTLIPVGEKRAQQVMDELKLNPYASSLLVREHLTWEEVARIELHQLALPGVSIETGQVRHYPLADRAAHLIGYVGAVSPEELEASGKMPLLRLPEYRIGKNGAERTLEERLRGVAGIRQMEVNVHGQVVRHLSMRPSVAGENVRLTVDARLQEYGARLLEGESASAIVLDVSNGDVLALVSVPGFDPNIFSKGIPADYWKELQANSRDPLLNKAIQGQYPPGSTFKMMVALAGLLKGTIRPETRVTCPGFFYLGDHRFNCWKEEGHGVVSLVPAIAMSCDTYFYTVAQRTGIEKISEVSRLCGLGQTPLLPLPSEKPGIMPDPEWKMKRFGQRWTTGDTVNVGIGQGYVLSTPLQLAVMAARLATGRQVRPRLTADGGTTDFPPLDIPEDYIKLIREGMHAVTNSGMGTAYGKRITEPAYIMAGKTGTSQVRRIERRGIRQESLPWEHRHHALFVGYAPALEPRYAVAVAVEHGGGGSAAAAPRARDLLWKAQLLADGKEHDPPTEPVKPLP